MKTIEYRIRYNDHPDKTITVTARNINAGFGVALRLAQPPPGDNLHSIEFWQALS